MLFDVEVECLVFKPRTNAMLSELFFLLSFLLFLCARRNARRGTRHLQRKTERDRESPLSPSRTSSEEKTCPHERVDTVDSSMQIHLPR